MKITYFPKQYGVTLTPFGAGSGLEGQYIPVLKGISINFERMNKILTFSPEDMLVTVQPASCNFSTLQQCAEAAHSILLSGIPVMRMEFADALSIKQVNI